MAALFHLLFFASGFSALLYEVVWVRQLASVFGVSAFALSAVLSAYFLGMALGAWWIGRRADRVERPLTAYGVLEGGAALLAMAITLGIPHLDRVLLPLLDLFEGRFFAQSVVRFGAALAVLIGPTALLGATLPVLARGLVGSKDELAAGVAQLYAVNTAGAVFGVLGAGFVLIPWVGLQTTAAIGAGVGLAVAAIAFAMSRRFAPASRPAERAVEGAPGDPAVLVAFAVSGFGALALEVIVMRMLNLLQSPSTLGIASMLAVFLAGIAIGSAWIARSIERVGVGAAIRLARVEAAIGAAALLSLWLFAGVRPLIAGLAHAFGEAPDALVQPRFALLAAAVVFLPPTLLLGATLPLAARAYVGGVATLGTQLGRLYGANTIGGVAGSFAAGFLLIPALGAERSLQAIALLFCANGAALALFARSVERPARTRAALAAAAIAVVVLLLRPNFLEAWMLARSGSQRVIEAREDYYGTVAVVERDEASESVRQLMVNGDFMSNTSLYARRYMRLASHLPALRAGEPPRRGLVICFGAGITVDALARHPGMEQVTVVELSRAVLESAPHFAHVNDDVLANPRVRAVVEDGRHYLLRHPGERYDVITLEPPPPAGAGVSNLYSRDFYELARSRLAPGGVMAQWVPIATQSPEATRAVLRAFLDVFPHAELWWTESLETLVLGSDRPFELGLPRARALLADPLVGPNLREIGIGDPYDLISYYLLGEAELAAWLADAEVVTDDHPVIEYKGAGSHDQNWRVLETLLQRRPKPAVIAQRFAFTPGEVSILIERLRKRLEERVKTK